MELRANHLSSHSIESDLTSSYMCLKWIHPPPGMSIILPLCYLPPLHARGYTTPCRSCSMRDQIRCATCARPRAASSRPSSGARRRNPASLATSWRQNKARSGAYANRVFVIPEQGSRLRIHFPESICPHTPVSYSSRRWGRVRSHSARGTGLAPHGLPLWGWMSAASSMELSQTW